MSADARALLGSLAATLGALFAVCGLVAGAPVLIVLVGTATAVGGAVLANHTARNNR